MQKLWNWEEWYTYFWASLYLQGLLSFWLNQNHAISCSLINKLLRERFMEQRSAQNQFYIAYILMYKRNTITSSNSTNALYSPNHFIVYITRTYWVLNFVELALLFSTFTPNSKVYKYVNFPLSIINLRNFFAKYEIRRHYVAKNAL